MTAVNVRRKNIEDYLAGIEVGIEKDKIDYTEYGLLVKDANYFHDIAQKLGLQKISIVPNIHIHLDLSGNGREFNKLVEDLDNLVQISLSEDQSDIFYERYGGKYTIK
mgnify:CR=1 FL=1